MQKYEWILAQKRKEAKNNWRNSDTSRQSIGFSRTMDRKIDNFSVDNDGATVMQKPMESSSDPDPLGKSSHDNQAPTKSHQGDNIQYPTSESLKKDKIIMLMKIDRTFDNTTSLSENGSKIVAKDSKEIVSCHEIKNDTAEESPVITVFRQQIEKVVSFGDQSLESLKVRKETVTTSHAFKPFKHHEENPIKDYTAIEEEESGKPEIQFEETANEEKEIQFVNVETPEGVVEVTELPQQASQNIEPLENALSTGESEIIVDSHTLLNLKELQVEAVKNEPTEVEEFLKVQVQVIAEVDNIILPEQSSPTTEPKVSQFDALDMSIGDGSTAEELANIDLHILGNPELQTEASKISPTEVEEFVRVQVQVIVEADNIILPEQSSPTTESKVSKFDALDLSIGDGSTAEELANVDLRTLGNPDLQVEVSKISPIDVEEFVKVQTTEVIVEVTDKTVLEQRSPSAERKQLQFEDFDGVSDGEYETAEVMADADSNNALDLHELAPEVVKQETTELEEFVMIQTTEVVVDVTDRNQPQQTSSSTANQP